MRLCLLDTVFVRRNSTDPKSLTCILSMSYTVQVIELELQTGKLYPISGVVSIRIGYGRKYWTEEHKVKGSTEKTSMSRCC